MAKYTVKTIENKEIWEKFVLGHNPQTFLQSWNWGETNKAIGKKIFRIGIFKNSQIVAVYLVIEEKAKRGPHLVIPGGPILDWEDKKLVRFVVGAIYSLAKEEGAWFVRIRPDVLDSEKAQKLFSELGFVAAPMHLHAENTWVLDITADEEALLRGMRKTTRYLIKKSLKTELVLEETTDLGSSSLLSRLQNETVTRHGFVGFPEELFKAQLKAFGKDNQARMFVCRYKGRALAAAIIIFYGDSAYYHHSGSTSKYSEIPSSYFLQWQIIREAKKRGCKYYNFWGIAPGDNPKHRFAGVTLFKKGFGGQKIDWLHARDLPVSLLYWFTHCFEVFRRVFRRL
ncbi:peptidoglycan bridge formation glycyltransferase FemA/FemB family protein [Patescibacteria group bacterium]|nr:peptidoglycan bridge formation glycyltransferase FemA/FemB family protein [Patescibacteria group bacterium]